MVDTLPLPDGSRATTATGTATGTVIDVLMGPQSLDHRANLAQLRSVAFPPNWTRPFIIITVCYPGGACRKSGSIVGSLLFQAASTLQNEVESLSPYNQCGPCGDCDIECT